MKRDYSREHRAPYDTITDRAGRDSFRETTIFVIAMLVIAGFLLFVGAGLL